MTTNTTFFEAVIYKDFNAFVEDTKTDTDPNLVSFVKAVIDAHNDRRNHYVFESTRLQIKILKPFEGSIPPSEYYSNHLGRLWDGSSYLWRGECPSVVDESKTAEETAKTNPNLVRIQDLGKKLNGASFYLKDVSFGDNSYTLWAIQRFFINNP